MHTISWNNTHDHQNAIKLYVYPLVGGSLLGEEKMNVKIYALWKDFEASLLCLKRSV